MVFGFCKVSATKMVSVENSLKSKIREFSYNENVPHVCITLSESVTLAKGFLVLSSFFSNV